MSFAIWIAFAALVVIAVPIAWALWKRQQVLGERLDGLKRICEHLSLKLADGMKERDDKFSELWNYTQKLGDTAKELAEKCDSLEDQIKELPVDQIQSIYDSEKQFQDGLSAIMAYGQQTFGLNKENVPYER